MSFDRSINAIEYAARVGRRSYQAAVSVTPSPSPSGVPTVAPVFAPASPSPSTADYAQRQSLPAYTTVTGLPLEWEGLLQTTNPLPSEEGIRLAVQRRDAAISTAVEAEATYQELSFLVSRDQTPSDYSLPYRLAGARTNADNAWADVNLSFEAEFSLKPDQSPVLAEELDLTHVDPVYRPWVLEQAGISEAPTELDQARVETNIVATRFANIDRDYQDLLGRHEDLPPELAIHSSLVDEIADVRQERAAALTDLNESAADNLRLAARSGDTTDAEVDVFLDESVHLQARLEMLGLSSVSIDSVSQSALMEARYSDPLTLKEAQAQTNHAIWDAISAENALVEHLMSDLPSGSHLDQFWLDRRAELTAFVDATWTEVGVRSAIELQFYSADIARLPVQDPSMMPSYRDSIANRGFPPLYISKIDHHVAQRAPSTAFDADPAEVAQVYIDRAQSAYDEGGAAALRTELDLIYGDLLDDSFVRGDATFTPAPPESDRRLQALQEQLAPGLRPLQLQLVADVPNELAELSAGRMVPGVFEPELDLEIASRLESTLRVIPEDMVANLLMTTKPVWSIGLESNQSNTLVFPVDPYGDTVPKIFRVYARIGDQLQEVSDGEPAFNLLVDSVIETIRQDDIGRPFTYTGLFEIAAKNGEGGALMVEVINRLSADDDFSANALWLSRALRDGSHQFFEDFDDHLLEWSDNRLEFDRLVNEFTFAADQTNPLEVWAPGQLNVTEMELADAIADYMDRNPEVAANDERLMRETMVEGKKVFDLSVAVARLSDDALLLEPNQALIADFDDFLDQDPSRTATVASNPLVLSSLQAQSQSALQSGGFNPVDFSWNPGRLEWLSGSQSEFSVARNFRFMLSEFANDKYSPLPALLPPRIASSPLMTLSGPALFVVAGTSALSDAAQLSDRDLSTFGRTVSGARAANYYYLTAREITATGANYLLARNSLPRVSQALTTAGIKLGLEPAAGGVGLMTAGEMARAEHLPARFAAYGPRVAFLVFDAYNIGNSLYNNDNGMVLGGHIVSGVGSSLMVINGAGGFSGTVAAGPIAWVGTALWFSSSIMVYQGNRITGYNQFETADARAFFSHIGSRNPITGELNPITEATWITPFESHPDSDQFRQVIDGAPTGSEIVYRGISANAVDELMNNDDNSSNPQSSLSVLSALAIRNEISPRVLTIDWFNHLTNEQQKNLPVAAFSVDESVIVSEVDPGFFLVYSPESFINASVAFRDFGLISDDDFAATIDYAGEWLFAKSPDPYSATLVFDAEALRGALGFGPRVQGQPAPDTATARTLDFLFGEQATGFQFSYRPSNTLELEAWLKLNHYPPLPAPVAPQSRLLPDRPEAAAIDLNYEPAPPIDREYVVQKGDTLWDIAARSSDAADVYDLIAHHNENTPNIEAQFDPARADSDFFSANELGLLSRDPDLINPGDVIMVNNVDNIADKESLADR